MNCLQISRVPTQYNLLVAFNQAIANLFPECPVNEQNQLVIPHGLAETTILRRHGIAAPAPMLSQYKWTGQRTPFNVQKITCEMLSTNQRAYVLSGMGVGKTACPLWTYDFLRQTKQATRMLIDAPLSTLDFVWMREMFEVQSPYKGVVLHGSRKKRLKLLDQEFDFYIINHDGLATIYDALMERDDIDTLTIDELAVFRNKNERTATLRRFVNGDGKRRGPIKWAWGMTGSPAPEAPTDVYQQAKTLTPHTVPKYFSTFREQTMYRITPFRWLPLKDAVEKAYAVFKPSVRFTLEDVGELPPYISRRIDVKLGKRQREIYEAIRKDALAVLGTQTISAVNQGVIANKLLQISLGYVYDNTKGIVVLDNQHTIDAILDILDAAEHPVLIPVGYKHALAGITEAITRAGWKAVPVSGDTPANERAKIFAAFQQGEYKALPCHPQCAAHGLTLTAADTVLWPGPIASLEIYDQFNARIRRTGQNKKQQFIHLQRTPAEKKLYSALTDKGNQQHSLLKLFEDELL